MNDSSEKLFYNADQEALINVSASTEKEIDQQASIDDSVNSSEKQIAKYESAAPKTTEETMHLDDSTDGIRSKEANNEEQKYESGIFKTAEEIVEQRTVGETLCDEAQFVPPGFEKNSVTCANVDESLLTHTENTMYERTEEGTRCLDDLNGDIGSKEANNKEHISGMLKTADEKRSDRRTLIEISHDQTQLLSSGLEKNSAANVDEYLLKNTVSMQPEVNQTKRIKKSRENQKLGKSARDMKMSLKDMSIEQMGGHELQPGSATDQEKSSKSIKRSRENKKVAKRVHDMKKSETHKNHAETAHDHTKPAQSTSESNESQLNHYVSVSDQSIQIEISENQTATADEGLKHQQLESTSLHSETHKTHSEITHDHVKPTQSASSEEQMNTFPADNKRSDEGIALNGNHSVDASDQSIHITTSENQLATTDEGQLESISGHDTIQSVTHKSHLETEDDHAKLAQITSSKQEAETLPVENQRSGEGIGPNGAQSNALPSESQLNHSVGISDQSLYIGTSANQQANADEVLESPSLQSVTHKSHSETAHDQIKPTHSTSSEHETGIFFVDDQKSDTGKASNGAQSNVLPSELSESLLNVSEQSIHTKISENQLVTTDEEVKQLESTSGHINTVQSVIHKSHLETADDHASKQEAEIFPVENQRSGEGIGPNGAQSNTLPSESQVNHSVGISDQSLHIKTAENQLATADEGLKQRVNSTSSHTQSPDSRANQKRTTKKRSEHKKRAKSAGNLKKPVKEESSVEHVISTKTQSQDKQVQREPLESKTDNKKLHDLHSEPQHRSTVDMVDVLLDVVNSAQNQRKLTPEGAYVTNCDETECKTPEVESNHNGQVNQSQPIQKSDSQTEMLHSRPEHKSIIDMVELLSKSLSSTQQQGLLSNEIATDNAKFQGPLDQTTCIEQTNNKIPVENLECESNGNNPIQSSDSQIDVTHPRSAQRSTVDMVDFLLKSISSAQHQMKSTSDGEGDTYNHERTEVQETLMVKDANDNGQDRSPHGCESTQSNPIQSSDSQTGILHSRLEQRSTVDMVQFLLKSLNSAQCHSMMSGADTKSVNNFERTLDQVTQIESNKQLDIAPLEYGSGCMNSMQSSDSQLDMLHSTPEQRSTVDMVEFLLKSLSSTQYQKKSCDNDASDQTKTPANDTSTLVTGEALQRLHTSGQEGALDDSSNVQLGPLEITINQIKAFEDKRKNLEEKEMPTESTANHTESTANHTESTANHTESANNVESRDHATPAVSSDQTPNRPESICNQTEGIREEKAPDVSTDLLGITLHMIETIKRTADQPRDQKCLENPKCDPNPVEERHSNPAVNEQKQPDRKRRYTGKGKGKHLVCTPFEGKGFSSRVSVETQLSDETSLGSGVDVGKELTGNTPFGSKADVRKEEQTHGSQADMEKKIIEERTPGSEVNVKKQLTVEKHLGLGVEVLGNKQLISCQTAVGDFGDKKQVESTSKEESYVCSAAGEAKDHDSRAGDGKDLDPSKREEEPFSKPLDSSSEGAGSRSMQRYLTSVSDPRMDHKYIENLMKPYLSSKDTGQQQRTQHEDFPLATQEKDLDSEKDKEKQMDPTKSDEHCVTTAVNDQKNHQEVAIDTNHPDSTARERHNEYITLNHLDPAKGEQTYLSPETMEIKAVASVQHSTIGQETSPVAKEKFIDSATGNLSPERKPTINRQMHIDHLPGNDVPLDSSAAEIKPMVKKQMNFEPATGNGDQLDSPIHTIPTSRKQTKGEILYSTAMGTEDAEFAQSEQMHQDSAAEVGRRPDSASKERRAPYSSGHHGGASKRVPQRNNEVQTKPLPGIGERNRFDLDNPAKSVENNKGIRGHSEPPHVAPNSAGTKRNIHVGVDPKDAEELWGHHASVAAPTGATDVGKSNNTASNDPQVVRAYPLSEYRSPNLQMKPTAISVPIQEELYLADLEVNVSGTQRSRSGCKTQ